MHTITLDAREMATVLAALHYWQDPDNVAPDRHWRDTIEPLISGPDGARLDLPPDDLAALISRLTAPDQGAPLEVLVQVEDGCISTVWTRGGDISVTIIDHDLEGGDPDADGLQIVDGKAATVWSASITDEPWPDLTGADDAAEPEAEESPRQFTYEDGFEDGHNEGFADILKAGSWHDDGTFVIEDRATLEQLRGIVE